MSFASILLLGFAAVMSIMTILWIISIIIKNVSIVDIFWGFGFVVVTSIYYIIIENGSNRNLLLLVLVFIWGMRLSIYLAKRNIGKPEDFRYQEFRRKYGENRYWWFSFFQTFLLQGVLVSVISLPILASMFYGNDKQLGWIDFVAIFVWLIGFAYEAGGDLQLSLFKRNKANKGKVLNTGFWKYTRHPNYFGDSAIWWAYGLFSISAGSYWPVLGSFIMTFFLVKVSGVALLEKTLVETKPQYREYIRRTSAFLPMPRKK